MKHKKKVLFQSLISLLLCFSMLVGITFAWFTDGVSSGTNMIAAGSLDIELDYLAADGTWKPVDENTEVLDKDALWEPGHTEVAYLRITNAGSLALKYALGIGILGEIGSTNTAGEAFKLSDYIEFGVVESESEITYAERADARNALTETKLIREGYSSEYTMKNKGDVRYVALVVYMPESVGNAANYATGKNPPKIELGIELVATQEVHESDSFGKDYDTGAVVPGFTFPENVFGESATEGVTADANNKVAADVTIQGSSTNAVIPAGVQLEDGADALTLEVTSMNQSNANITLGENDAARSLNVHVEGVSADNTVPMEICIKEAAANGLNAGNLKLYHVENGVTVEMTAVDTFTAHNQFKYDPATGDITLYMATFSEVAVVADTVNAWEGNFDYSWYTNAVAPVDGEAVTEYIIANADQLAAFGAIVGGMNGQTQDSFAGKIVKLIADVNLGDKDNANESLIFHPIGYYYTDDKNADSTTGDYYSTVYSFEGTFDGNGHTISNFYHNTWEIKGDYDGNYYDVAMGLFGYVNGGTVKNLTVDNFSSDGEYTPTGVIAAYADGNSTFENIAITNCNPRVYNTGNGGIIGIAGDTSAANDDHITLKNITVDNSNKISALWGSWDVACGGLVGMYRGNVDGSGNATGDTISFENCHVSAIIDVYNDVCANYQYYAYRYAGMIIGSVRHNTKNAEGKVIPNMTGISATGCTVNYGDWNDYYYCEFEKNTMASYSEDYQFSRVPHSELNFTDSNGNGVVDADERASVTGCKHTHTAEENHQAIYLPFHQLFTGYSWGVSSIGLEELAGIKNITVTVGQEESVEKFSLNSAFSSICENEIHVGDLFSVVDGANINGSAVQVAVSALDSNGITAEYVADVNKWENGTLTFSSVTGLCSVTIQDYNFCKPTTVILKDGKLYDVFAKKFTGSFLYRVGNQNAISLSSLFNENGIAINDSSVKVAITGVHTEDTADATAWEKGTIKFSGTGVATVTIQDETYCNVTELKLEVVDAVNATTATNATSNNVVLLNDISSGFTVSGRYTVYGNGFTLNYTGNGQYLNNGLKQGIVTVSENGKLDNLRIKASIYPASYLYYEEVKKGPSSVEGDRTRYHYQLSGVVAKDNATISNCYVYGARTNVFVDTGNVTIKDSILECGTLANIQIQSTSEYTVTLENVTTIQSRTNPTIGDTSLVMLGAGVIVGPDMTSNPTIVLNGNFKQYNWVTTDDQSAVSNSTAKAIIGTAVGATQFNHTVNGKISSNLGIIYLNNFAATVTNNTELPYVLGEVTMMGQAGQVYSLQNGSGSVYIDPENADKNTENGIYEPQFKYSADLGGQYVAEGGDEHCYREGDAIYVMFPSGDTKELNLKDLVEITKYSNQELNLQITAKDENNKEVTVTDGKVSLSDAGKYTVTYTVTDTLFYDKNGNVITDAARAVSSSSKKYSWDVILDVSLKDTAIPDARFEFDATKQKMGYYKPSLGDVKQYLPFLAGLKIYDCNGKTEYLRFDGSSDFNKVASVTITGYASNKASVEIKLTDGGVINTQFLARANSGGGSTYTGKIKTSNNTIYFVTDSGTSNKDTTTTAAYWYVDYYKFIGNNGVAIQSGQQTFNSIGSSASTPSGSFGTTIKYTVTYDANGGNCGQTVGYATSAAAAVTLPTPTRSGYIFAGWYTAASGGTRVGGAGESYTPSANITLYAQWGKPCDVTYNANGGSCGTASEKYTGTALTLPTPTRDGYWFIGWYDAAEGGNKIGDAGATYNPSGEITLYAHWQEKVEYTVTYNVNGGSCGTASATYQGTVLTLPTPTRTGYTFNGWYTAASGGTKIGDAGESYIPSANITLYAQWTQNEYTITVSTSNATVTGVTNGQKVHYGDTISVTVSFSQSNNRTLTVKDASGNTVLSKSAAGTYTFTMPASNVTISASSEKSCVTGDTLVMLADGTEKRIDKITYQDQLLVWNFFEGKYDVVPAAILFDHGEEVYEVLTLNFSDGTQVKTINGHGFFDMELNAFAVIDTDNVESYIGHKFAKVDGDGVKAVELVDYIATAEFTGCYSIQSAVHINFVTEGMLSETVPPFNGWFEYFEIGEGMKYDEAKMQADIEKYGLYEYSDFAAYVTYEQFIAFNGPYLKVLVGRGVLTFEQILELIATYVN